MDLIDHLNGFATMHASGILAGRIAENTLAGIPLRLEHTLAAVIDDPKSGRGGTNPLLDLVFPAPGIRSWKQWAGLDLAFPGSTLTKLVDGDLVATEANAAGAITIPGERALVLCARMRCGPISASRLVLRIHLLLFQPRNFLSGPPDGVLDLDVDAELGSTAVVGNIGLRHRPGQQEVVGIAQRFLELADYERTEEGNVVSFRPRID